ncbi:MAG: SMP-30/gluconolactonase/LRE family protein [Burkholderiaceae bacterium]|nr:SMP-30/gluconolactonase/LRE family protein [Burkholderiaceae bacterium]
MSTPFTPNARLPDPSIEVLDERFLALRLFSATVERLATGFYWAEGPVWFGDGRYLLFSDIPNNRILRWDDCSGALSEFRKPSNNANGHARDRQGRLISCEHLTRRITRTEYDGSITVLADRFDGKRLNSPNDIVCARDGSIWFTDPLFGILGKWEGEPAESETPMAVYRLPADGSKLQRVIDDLNAPNGLAFSPDEKILYVVESRATPHRKIWAYDVAAGGKLAHKRVFADAQGPGAYDGIKVDVTGHVWCGFGSSSGMQAEALDGVRVYAPDGAAVAQIHLPERCANLCFGGPKNNRLFMAASHSLYALYVNTTGAV